MNERKNSKRIIHLVGMGPGAPEKLTAETIIILKKADLIAGSVRMLEQARKVVSDLDEKTTLASFRNEEIIQFIEEHPGELDLIEWVLFDRNTFNVYDQALGQQKRVRRGN